MKIVTNQTLRERFPKYIKDIDAVAGKAACGCSGCTLNYLRQKHPDENFDAKIDATAVFC